MYDIKLQGQSRNMLVGGFMVFNALSTIFQLYHGGQFYWWMKAGENLPPVTGKLYNNDSKSNSQC